MKKMLALVLGIAASAGVLSEDQESNLAPKWYTHFQNGTDSGSLCFVASGAGETEDAAETVALFNLVKNVAKTAAAEVTQVKFSQESGLEGSKKFNSLRSSYFAKKLNGGNMVKQQFEKKGDEVIAYMMIEFRDGHCAGKWG